ncbi:MAG: hypothetical protein LBJ90_00110 [Treponema sp.]|jgi:hypothetical protein|nr:hypothetical protein [Treponema sp.]
MKNPAASSGVSSFEKKKSYGLFHFVLGVCYPAIIGEGIEPPQRVVY